MPPFPMSWCGNRARLAATPSQLRETFSCSYQQVLILQAEHHRSPVAAVVLVPVGDVCARCHDTRNDAAERQFEREASGQPPLP
jgi:hypothetical protein